LIIFFISGKPLLEKEGISKGVEKSSTLL